LFGRRVLVTRARHQASALADLLRREGASPIELPTIELAPAATTDELDAMVQRLEAREYAWCLLTSTNAVEWLWDAVTQRGHDARLFAGCKLGALGTATAEALKPRGLNADLTAGEFTSEGLLAAMPAALDTARVLLPRGDGASPALVAGMRDRGASVDEVILYESRAPREADTEALRLLREGRIDVVTFASSSSVRNLKALLGADFERLREVTVACIGPVTASTARELGLTVAVEPATHTIPALVAALKDHLPAQAPRRA
jgi:uroporphyrinogen III methyltransferase/synthase